MSTKARKPGKVPVTVYFDGFNLYHALEMLNSKPVKWISYWKLAESFIRQSEHVQGVHLFTSLTPWDHGKKLRHNIFMDAQRAVGVTVHEARFKKNRRKCRTQNRNCKFWEEKENDVAIAVRMLADAHAGITRRIVLVTADTDQIPAIKYLMAAFPQIELSLFVPPNRKNEARDLGALFHRTPVEIDEGRLVACALPLQLTGLDGKTISRPPEYAA